MAKLICPICGRSVRLLKDHIARFHPEHLEQPHSPPKPKIIRLASTSWSSIQGSNSHKQNIGSIIIVDGQNVAYFGEFTKPSYLNLKIIYEALISLSYTPKIVISSALKYKIDDPVRLNRFMSRRIAIEAPSGEDDDLTILELANDYQAKIITNDRYLNHQDIFPDLKKQLIKFQIFNRSVKFTPPL